MRSLFFKLPSQDLLYELDTLKKRFCKFSNKSKLLSNEKNLKTV